MDFISWYDSLPDTKELKGLRGKFQIKNFKPFENSWANMIKAQAEEAWDYQQQKIDLYEKALGFYESANYETEVDRLGYLDSSRWEITYPEEILEDCGQTAREALEKGRGM